MAVVAEDRIGTELAGYLIERVLGRGGMSVVYLAHDPRLQRKVALKLLSADLAEDEAFRKRFLRESQLAASLDHPNVVPVYEAGEVDGLLYIAMRYVVGTDLKALLRAEGAFGPERALVLVGQVASALDAAHERGLVHRDVKPSNVLLTGQPGEEHCYLADFGLSTSASDRSVAEAGQMLGTIDYVAPEQIRGADVDGRADVYSLTCLLYECLVGEVPFRRASDVAVIYAHLEEPLPKASEREASLPATVDEVLGRGTAKIPDERWQTCAALVEATRSAFGGRPTTVPARRSRRRGIAAVLTGVAAVAAAFAALTLGGEGTALAQSDSLVRIDVRGGEPAGGAAVGERPTAVTVCGGSVWVTTRDGTVFQVDPKSLTPHTVRVRGTPSDVANVGDLAAVVSGPPEQVTMVDAQFGQISGVVTVPRARVSATAVAFGRDGWVANPTGRSLDLLAPPYTGVTASVPLPGAPRLVAAGERAVWAVGGRTLWRIDPRALRVVGSTRLPFAPRAIDAGRGGVWLADEKSDDVVRVDPASGRRTRVEVGDAPIAIAVGANAVWVANKADATVSRIDPRRNAVDRTVPVGAEPIDLVAGLGAVWVVRRT